MAKKLPSDVKASQPANLKKRSAAAAADELDDIFSSARLAKKVSPSSASASRSDKTGSSTTDLNNASEASKKKKKKQKSKVSETAATAADSTSGASDEPAAKKVVTVLDSSDALSKAQQPDLPAGVAGDDEERFMDSRGTRRKTEDGLPIYTFDELKIGLGGETELCPFDCQCCF